MARMMTRTLGAIALTSLILLGHSDVGQALVEGEVDSSNAVPHVGAIMVWREASNPLGLPGDSPATGPLS